jgi:hypothetical protein
MTFEFKCEKCENIDRLELSMMEDIPAKVKCTACKGESKRVWGNTTIKIPDHMKAQSDINDGGYADYDNLKSTFKNAKRPSGKEKVYY